MKAVPKFRQNLVPTPFFSVVVRSKRCFDRIEAKKAGEEETYKGTRIDAQQLASGIVVEGIEKLIDFAYAGIEELCMVPKCRVLTLEVANTATRLSGSRASSRIVRRKSLELSDFSFDSGEFKIRYSYVARPREEWLFVPVPDAGVSREVVEAARQSLKDNARKPSRAAKRFWELSEDILRCGGCGHTLRAHTSYKKSGRRFHYYSCRSRYNTGPNRDCGNTKHLRAEQIEEQVGGFVRGLLRDPERIRAGLDRLIEEERINAGRDPKRDAGFWSRKLTEVERRGYHRLAVKGHMTDEELAAALAELDETRETAERELEAAQARGEALQRLEHDRDALMESYAGMVSEALEDLTPEERHRVYKLRRLSVHFRSDWPLEITGVFMEVREEAETSLSPRKLSPGSFSGDEPPALKFSALLTEGGAERLELAIVGFAPKVRSDQKPQT